MITILDYGLGNIGSLNNMLKRLNQNVIITSKPEHILNSKKLIIPGVGSFDKAISNINNVIGLREALNVKALNDKIPILGICLGMQLLTRKSEEGILNGFNWIPGEVKKFDSTKYFKVPHMGWNEVKTNNKKLKILENIDKGSRFYFVHSYYVEVDNKEHSLFKTTFNISFDSGIYRDNLYGVQFHPEKSHKFGMNILKNFSELRC
jgi:glutamine amidotransferase